MAKCQHCNEFWERVPDDVPVFLIVGYDLLAQEIVAEWIDRAKSKGVNAEKIARAMTHLTAIAEFQRNYPERCKLPD